jgi:hypothetical protein
MLFLTNRRNFLRTTAGDIAGLAAGSLPARVLAQSADGPPFSISTIGAGREGGALGALFVKAGHRVMFSSRHPDTLKGLVDELGPLARAGTVAEAVEFGDVLRHAAAIDRAGNRQVVVPVNHLFLAGASPPTRDTVIARSCGGRAAVSRTPARKRVTPD